MTAILPVFAKDRSTYVVTASFADEDGVSVVPSAIVWSLSTPRGTIINSRSAVPIASAASIDILLGAADLDYDDGSVRILTIVATYDSTLGSNLTLKDQAQIRIEDLVII